MYMTRRSLSHLQVYTGTGGLGIHTRYSLAKLHAAFGWKSRAARHLHTHTSRAVVDEGQSETSATHTHHSVRDPRQNQLYEKLVGCAIVHDHSSERYECLHAQKYTEHYNTTGVEDVAVSCGFGCKA